MQKNRIDSSAGNQIPANYVQLRGSERRPSPTARLLGAADAKDKVRVTIALRRRTDGAPIPSFDYFANTPPSMRRRLPEDEFAANYGAHPSEIDRVVKFAASHGLSVVQTHAGRRSVVVTGNVAQMNGAFGINLGLYEHSAPLRGSKQAQTETYRGRDGFINVPKELADIVVGVFGLDNRRITKRNGNPGDPPFINPVPIPTITQLYSFPTAPATGQTIGILSLGGYLESDLQAFFAPHAPPVLPDISVDASNGLFPDGETTQDICIAASAAPGANIQTYFTSDDQVGWFDLVHRVVHPEAGDPACSVLSSSDYICDGDDLPTLANEGISIGFVYAVHDAFIDAAIQGVTIVIAAGDTGSNSKIGANPAEWGWSFAGDGNAHLQYPGSDPWVLSVGGTTLGGTASNPPPFVEYVWNDPDPSDPSQWGTTAGGVSDFFDKPSYQSSANVPVSVNPPHTRVGRGVPDVSGNASFISGYSGLIVGGAPFVGNGTSASAPLWAGLIALINAGVGDNVGFVNPMIYALGSSVFNDINPPPGPTTNSNSGIPGYTAGPGWDACTGWGSPHGQQLLTAIQQANEKDCFIILDWSTFAKAGIDEMLAQASPNPAVFNPGLYVVADWFTPADLGVGTANPVQPVVTLSPTPLGITLQLMSGPTADGAPANPNAPQRYTYTYQITVSSDMDFPATDIVKTLAVQASITGAISGVTVTSAAVIDLTNPSAPFMVPGSTSWLSNDIRVFQLEQGVSPAWLTSLNQQLQNLAPQDPQAQFIASLGNTGNPTADATTFIQEVIRGFNVVAALDLPPMHPFDGISTSESVSELDIDQTDPSTHNPVYNFAVARVRYQDPIVDAENVRVFFRTFPALAVSTAYEPATYRRWSDGVEFGDTIPLLGSQFDPSLGMQLETVPFFAEPRVNATQVSMDTQTDAPNVQTLAHNPNNMVTYAYYGCWLDINQPQQTPYPQVPTGDGPFSGATLVPILSLLANQHQCITAEIAYDPIPIPTGATPSSSPMLGQRNLTLGTAANPGNANSRTVSNPFQMRSTPINLPRGAKPDELMIDWGDVPMGSTATLYLPEADARAIVDEAATLYGQSIFTLVDTHTLSFAAEGITYVPIPTHNGTNLAGMLSVELPLGIKYGQNFNAVIRQLTSVTVESDKGERDKRGIQWRRILGSFQLTIPILHKKEMLAPEERLLSILRWMETWISKESRWLPVFTRFVQATATRVQDLGGNPMLVIPSPTGSWEVPIHNGYHVGCREYTGKVSGIAYDRFGDMEGFMLETEDGHERSFHTSEPEMEALIGRAWRERIVISVVTEASKPHTPASIIYRRAPMLAH